MPKFTELTKQNIITMVAKSIKQQIETSDFNTIKTLLINRAPVQEAILLFAEYITLLQKEEENEIINELQRSALENQKKNDEEEAICDKQEEADDNVDTIGEKLNELKLQKRVLTEKKQILIQTLHNEKNKELNGKIFELIDTAIVNQEREDESEARQDRQLAKNDTLKNLNDSLNAVAAEIYVAKKQVDEKFNALELEYATSPDVFKQKTGSAALDAVDFLNFNNRDLDLQTKRNHLNDLKSQQHNLNDSIQNQPQRQKQREMRQMQRNQREEQAIIRARHYPAVTHLGENPLTEQLQTLRIYYYNKLSAKNYSLLEANLKITNTQIQNNYNEKQIQQLKPLEQDNNTCNKKTTQLNTQLQGVAGRTEKRNIKFNNRAQRAQVRQLFPQPTNDTSWENQLTTESRKQLNKSIRQQQDVLGMMHRRFMNYASTQSYTLLITGVKDYFNAADLTCNALQAICELLEKDQDYQKIITELRDKLSGFLVSIEKQNVISNNLIDEYNSLESCYTNKKSQILSLQKGQEQLSITRESHEKNNNNNKNKVSTGFLVLLVLFAIRLLMGMLLQPLPFVIVFNLAVCGAFLNFLRHCFNFGSSEGALSYNTQQLETNAQQITKLENELSTTIAEMNANTQKYTNEKGQWNQMNQNNINNLNSLQEYTNLSNVYNTIMQEITPENITTIQKSMRPVPSAPLVSNMGFFNNETEENVVSNESTLKLEY